MGLTNSVFNLGKNMKKMTEIGYQRLLVALPSKLSEEELREYNMLVLKLCEKLQLLDAW
jgi:hypothetical protein